MNRLSIVAVVLLAASMLVGVAGAQKSPKKSGDVLVGVLRVHPKFHYRYFIDGFGDGQHCALFLADNRLKLIEPGNSIRVRGNLASKFFGNPKDPSPALIRTWVIYMDVDRVEVIRGPAK